MRTRRHKLQVSTFPFLAVLLCAMGALLLVLLVMDRRAHDAVRFRAAQAARRAAEEAGREAEARHSAFERQRQEARDARQRDREAAHARLAGQEADVQKEIRLVRDELTRAAERLRAEQDDEAAIKQKIEAEHAKAGEEERALAAVRAEAAAKAARSETSRQELERMTAALARLEKNLADLKEARKREENTYSVVPYNGRRGENRRPVYVECAAGRVIFHPDRTPLDEPVSASAVRAEVERRLARQKEGLPAAQAAALEPYLMLLIRPDGISTYYRFRQALQGFRIDFGYEFVDKDWVLDFPSEDRDAPAPAWLTAAKPSGEGPSSPDAASRMHGVPSKPGQEEAPAAPNPGGNAGHPGAPSLLAGSGMAYSAGGSGLPFPAGSASAGPRGATGVGPATESGGSSLFAPSGVGPGGAVAGLAGRPRPYPGGGSPNAGASGSGPPGAGASGFGPPGAGVIGDGPPGAGASGDGPPGPAAPGDARPIAAGPGGSSGPAAQRGSLGNAGGSPTPLPLVVASTAGSGQPAAPGAAPATDEPPTAPGGTGASRSSTAGSWATQGAQAAPASTDPAAQADKPSGSPAPDPNQGTSPTPPPAGAAKATPPGRTGGASGGTAGGGAAAAGDPDDDPFLQAPPSPPVPHKTRQPAPLRPARLSGDRDWIVYVECKPEGVVIYPTQLLVPLAALNRPSGSNPLPQTIQRLIDRKQATVRRGEMPYRPEVRFLVRPEAERTFHLAYPTLDGLAAPKTSQILGPEDDVSAVVAGH